MLVCLSLKYDPPLWDMLHTNTIYIDILSCTCMYNTNKIEKKQENSMYVAHIR